MAQDHEAFRELRRLQEIALQQRLRSVELQLAFGFTLCAIAETEFSLRPW